MSTALNDNCESLNFLIFMCLLLSPEVRGEIEQIVFVLLQGLCVCVCVCVCVHMCVRAYSNFVP
jgi:hypothetical protein